MAWEKGVTQSFVAACEALTRWASLAADDLAARRRPSSSAAAEQLAKGAEAAHATAKAVEGLSRAETWRTIFETPAAAELTREDIADVAHEFSRRAGLVCFEEPRTAEELVGLLQRWGARSREHHAALVGWLYGAATHGRAPATDDDRARVLAVCESIVGPVAAPDAGPR